MFERFRPFGRARDSWIIANKLYLLPVLAALAFVNAAAALGSIFFVLFVFIINVMKARLPIDPGTDSDAETYIYKKGDDYELKLDVWRPEEGRWSNATVVFAHGGGWISGYRNQPNNISWCRFLCSRGFNVVSVDYRFGFRYSMADILEDYSDAVAFIRREQAMLGLNVNNLILMGLSAGGHLALSYSAYNTASSNHSAMEGVRGVVAYYSPSDLRDLFAEDEKSLFARFAAGSTMKTLPRFDEDAYRRYSPVTWFTPRMVPVIAVHGRRDKVVPFRSSVKMITRLRELGVPCRFLEHRSGGHCFEVNLKDYRTTKILEETVRFMKELAAKG